MSFDRGRIGQEPGEWFERYVEDIFRVAGFKTQRDYFKVQSVRHEIDVWAELEVGTKIIGVAVECKDWSQMASTTLKDICDKFIGKVHQFKPDAGLVVINLPDWGQYARYRQQLKDFGIVFWDSKEAEKWKDDIERYDRPQYQKRLCDALGIVITEPTKTERTFKILKSLGKATYKTAKVIGENLAEDEPPRRRRRRG